MPRSLVRFGLVGVTLIVGCIATPSDPGSSSSSSSSSTPQFSAAFHPAFTAVDLGTLGGFTSLALDINEAGQIVGESELANGERHAFVWDAINGMRDLGTLGGTFSRAQSINVSGKVVGTSEDASGELRPYAWTEATGMVDIGSFGGGLSEAGSINDAGLATGWSLDTSGFPKAFLWSAGDGLRNIGRQGNVETYGIAIAKSRTIIGFDNIKTFYSMFIWRPPTGFTSLQSPLGGSSIPLDLNDLGHAVGSHGQFDAELPFLWEPGEGFITLAHDGPGYARGINRLDQAVGTHFGPPTFIDAEPSLWITTQARTSLPALGGANGVAEGINDGGIIVGWSETAGGAVHATVWVPSGTPFPLSRKSSRIPRASGFDSEAEAARVASCLGRIKTFRFKTELGDCVMGSTTR